MSTSFDLAIIGGGIIGWATADAVKKRWPDLRAALFEKEARLATHQTGHNSGVIHAGLYYSPGTLKARHCISGREALYRFCQEEDIPYEQCGKLVIAADDSEIAALEEIERRGQANGLHGLIRLNPKEIRDREPSARGVAGLFVPQTGIVDFVKVSKRLAERFRDRGGVIRCNAPVAAVRRTRDGFQLKVGQDLVSARYLINCAGLHADRLARRCGVAPDLQIIPFRGEYYELVKSKRNLVCNLIYPVPDSSLPFLGVHFTRMIDGMVEAGPNAVLALKREGYRWRDISLCDLAETFAFPGFWKLAARFWRVGLKECRRSISKKSFVASLQRMIPEIRLEDVRVGNAGVRAQAVGRDGQLIDDFRLSSEERMVHVLNAPSPAATAALSIGQTIVEQFSGLYLDD